MERCVLCGGRLNHGRCVDCGMDNTKNDKRYQLNAHNEKGISLHEGDCEDALNIGYRRLRGQQPIKGANAPQIRLQGSQSGSSNADRWEPGRKEKASARPGVPRGENEKKQAAKRPTAPAKQRQNVGTVKKKKHGGLFVLLLLILYFLLTVFSGMRKEEEWLGGRADPSAYSGHHALFHGSEERSEALSAEEGTQWQM